MERRLSGHATWHHTHDGWNVACRGMSRPDSATWDVACRGARHIGASHTRRLERHPPQGLCRPARGTRRAQPRALRPAGAHATSWVSHADMSDRDGHADSAHTACQAHSGNGTPSQRPGEGTSGVDPQRLVAVSTRPRGQQPMWAFQPQRVSERRHPGRVGCTPIKPCFERRKFRPPGRPGLAASHTQYTAGARGHLASRRRRPPSAAPQSPGFERPCSFAAACHCLELIVEGVLAAFRLELVVALDAAAALDAVVALDAARHSMRFSARRSRAAHALRR